MKNFSATKDRVNKKVNTASQWANMENNNYNSATAKVETTQLKTHKDYNRCRGGLARKRNASQTLRKMHPLQTQKTWCEGVEKSDPLCAGRMEV